MFPNIDKNTRNRKKLNVEEKDFLWKKYTKIEWSLNEVLLG